MLIYFLDYRVKGKNIICIWVYILSVHLECTQAFFSIIYAFCMQLNKKIIHHKFIYKKDMFIYYLLRYFFFLNAKIVPILLETFIKRKETEIFNLRQWFFMIKFVYYHL